MAQLQNFAYTGNRIEERVAASSTITRQIRRDNIPITTLSAEPFNGLAVVRYDGIVRNLFTENRIPLRPENGEAWVDDMLCVRTTIDGATYTFVRGVAQVGEPQVATQFRFLTTLPKVYCYRGYEHTLCLAVSDDLDSYSLRVDAADYIGHLEMLAQGHAVIVINPTDIHDYAERCTFDIFNREEVVVEDSIKKENKPIPDRPFYIRWINDLGGYDYWMFSCKQKHSIALASVSTYEVYEDEGVQHQYDKQASYTIETSSGLVDAQTLKALSRLPFSPDIRWYDEKSGEWVKVTMPATTFDYMSDQPTGEYIATFILPTPNINQ